MDYRFTRSAENDLDEILSYIAVELSNPIAAARFIDELEEKIGMLVGFPRMGRTVDNDLLTVAGIRKIPVGGYILYYLPDEQADEIIIMRLIFSRRDPELITEELNNTKH